MKRILIIGCSGAGKSTLARELGEILKIPVIHLDKLYWKTNWVKPSKEEWKSITDKAADEETWIIDGNYSGTIDSRLKRADTIIFLKFSRLVCITRVIWRAFKHWNTTREDMATNCRERIDWKFLKYVWNYNRVRRPMILEKLNTLDRHSDKTLFIFGHQREVNNFVRIKAKHKASEANDIPNINYVN